MENEQEESLTQNYSLEADLVTGWKPKLKIIGPMPLNFDNRAVDRSIMALLHQDSAFYTISYLGPRPASTFQLHDLLARNYRYKYNYLLHNDFAHLKPFFRKFYSQFEPEVKRPYHGMNPSISKKQIVFDSCFEGGNLDCAVRLRAQEYDIILRVDSNTAGHVLWYYFRMKNAEQSRKTIKLNLINLRRNHSAYERGMRPYVKRQGRQWQQEGQNVSVSEEKLKYFKQNFSISMQENLNQQFLFRKLSFELDLQAGESIEVAYSIPYTYSQLLNDVRSLKKKSQKLEGVQFEVDFNHQSLSGLEIPVIKLKHGLSSNNQKYCIFMIGRQHPGESNSSYVIKGSIEQLLSGDQQSMKVLKNCDFVIIPMLNPDGVVAGNFRTSLFGKDLNRLFKTRDTTLIPEIQMARDIFTKLSDTYKRKLLLFLDYHGHSTRKNAFLLGPGICDAQLLNDIRILPKIMSMHSQIFRYPSCSFRLDNSKKTTARALFGKLSGLSYTIEASNWSFYSQKTGLVVEFTAQLWEELGMGLIRAVQQFIIKKLEAKNKQDNRVKDDASRKLKLLKSKQQIKMEKSQTFREKIELKLPKSKEARTYTETVIIETEADEKQLSQFNENFEKREQQIFKQANESDEMSADGMDTDSQGEDMQQQKFKKYIKAASEMLVEFEQMYYGENYRKGFSKYRFNPNSRSNKLLMKDKKSKIEPTQACLRQRQKKIEPSQNAKLDDAVKQSKKKINQEQQLFVRESKSKPKSELRSEKNIQKRKIKLKLLEPSRKGKVMVNGLIKYQYRGLTEQLAKFQKMEIVHLEKSNEIQRKRDVSNDRMRIDTKSSHPVLINNPILPYIKASKTFLEETMKSSSHIMKGRPRDTFGEMLASQQNINKKSVEWKKNKTGTDFSQNSIIFFIDGGWRGSNWCYSIISPVRIQMQNINRRVRGKQGQFTLGELLGQGQFGRVYRGYSSNYPQGVAIKIIRKSKFNRNQKLKSLLQRQMEVLSGFKHPNVIELHELINDKNDVYLVYEYCEGGTLEDRITMGQDKLMPLLGQIVEALVQAEKLGIIHRDLKPANILFKKGKIKIADWGFSRLLAYGETTCSFIGSPAYMAPQVLKNEEYSLKADIWSLGVMLFEALTGNCPWVSSNISSLYLQVLKNPVSFPKDTKISDSMKQLISQMLILAPRNRLSSSQILQKIEKMNENSSRKDRTQSVEGQQRIMSCVFFLEIIQWGRKQLNKTSKLLLVVRLVEQNLMRLKTKRKDLQINLIWQKQMKVINEMRRKLEAKTLAKKKSLDHLGKRQVKTRESDDNPESQWDNLVKQSIKYAIEQLEVCYKSMQNKQQRLIELNIILDLIIFPQMPQEYLKIPLANYLQELQTYTKKTLLKLLNYKLLLINKKYYHE